MHKVLAAMIIVIFLFSISCKNSGEGGFSPRNIFSKGSAVVKYSKAQNNVYKDQSLNKDTWMAYLAKGEEVVLLDTKDQVDSNGKVILDKSGNKIPISKIKLADNSIGYLKSSALADKPVVFLTDTKLLVRPTVGSNVITTIPKGTIAFIIDQQNEWIQIYAGNIIVNGKKVWVDKYWTNEGYSTESSLLLQAREYEKALQLISEKKIEEALTILEELSNEPTVIGELAKDKYYEISGESLEGEEEIVEEETTE